MLMGVYSFADKSFSTTGNFCIALIAMPQVPYRKIVVLPNDSLCRRSAPHPFAWLGHCMGAAIALGRYIIAQQRVNSNLTLT
jgi:hypothetical protein